MSHTRVIFNPTAAGGRAARSRSALRERLQGAARGAGVRLDWVETRAPGHAVALAREAARQGCELVVAAGGDGTVNEVVNGLMPGGPALGIVPVGSGNDLAWFAGVAPDPLVACRRLFDGRARVVDVGHIREGQGRARYFHNGCGIGFEGRVALEAQRQKRLPGFLVYLVAVLKTLVLHHRAPRLNIRLDERELTQPSMMLTVSNGRRHGGGFHVTPDARLDDGLLDVCLAGELSRLGMLLVIPRFMRGTHVTHRQIRMDRAGRVTVASPEPLAIHLDGEVFATDARQIEVRVISGALRLRI